MRPRWTAVALLPLLLAPLASAADDEPLKGDLARLQGAWTAKVGPDKDVPITLTFKRQSVEIALTLPDGRPIKLQGEIRIDDQASPKRADWVKFANPQGDQVADNLALYKLDGDTWTTVSGGPGRDRPTEFKAGDEGPPNLTVWTRVKPAKPAEAAMAPNEKPGDLARFQGTWKAMSGPDSNLPVTLRIKDDAITATWPNGDGGSDELKGKFRLDEKAEPRTIDFTGFKKTDGDPLRPNLGIYVFDGATLRICVAGPDEARPSKFASDPKGFPMLLLFRKE